MSFERPSPRPAGRSGRTAGTCASPR